MTTTSLISETGSTSTTPRRSWLGPATAVWSLLAALVGAWWLTDPDAYPDHFVDLSRDGSLLSLVDPQLVSGSLVALGVAGAVVAVAGTSRRLLLPFGVSYAVVFGLLTTDLVLLVTMGYATAILGPPLLFGYLVLASLRQPRLRWVVAGIVAVVATGIAALEASAASFTTFAEEMGRGLDRSGPGMLAVSASFLGGVLWLLVAVRAAGFTRTSGTTAPAYTRPRRDWGWWVTVAAAICPLPYALLRVTWLTPWPTIIDAETLEADPATRIFGLSLGLAAIGGTVLTLGLLMRWGSVYPRWIPVVGGRPVSPTWPTVLAVVIGVAVTVAGRSMIQMSAAGLEFAKTGAETFLILPFPVWGPLLIAAAIAYHRRRTVTS